MGARCRLRVVALVQGGDWDSPAEGSLSSLSANTTEWINKQQAGLVGLAFASTMCFIHKHFVRRMQHAKTQPCPLSS